MLDSWRSSGPLRVEYQRNQLHDTAALSSMVTVPRLFLDRNCQVRSRRCT